MDTGWNTAGSASSFQNGGLMPELLDSTHVILGSKSATRRLILEEMGFNVQIRVADIDEQAIGDREVWSPESLVMELARAKATAVLNRYTDLNQLNARFLITGDQVVVHENRILEKPRDLDEARTFIKSYGESPPSTVGAVVITNLLSGNQVEGIHKATIEFEPFPEEVVDELLADEAMILNCAGGLMVEHEKVQPFIKNILGSLDSLMGLSKDLVAQLIVEVQK